MYILGARTVGRAAGVAAAIFVALSPFAVYYAIDARAYATLMFTTALSTLALLTAIRSDSFRSWSLYAVSICAAVYTHYTAIFVLAAQTCWALWVRRDRWRPLLLAPCAAALGYLPWLSHFNGQNQSLFDVQTQTLGLRASSSLVTWLIGIPFLPLREVPGALAFTFAVLAVVASIVGSALSVGRRPGRPDAVRVSSPVVLLAVLAAATPLGLLAYRAITGHELVSFPRNLSASLVYAALILGWTLTREMATPWRATSVAAAVAALAVLTSKTLAARFARPPFNEAASFLDAHARPGEPVVSTGNPLARVIVKADLLEYLQKRHPMMLADDADLGAILSNERASGRVYAVRFQSSAPPRLPPGGLVRVGENFLPRAKPSGRQPGAGRHGLRQKPNRLTRPPFSTRRGGAVHDRERRRREVLVTLRRGTDQRNAIAGFVVVTVGLALAGYWDMFEGFAPWDDEGTVLIALQGVARGDAPYTDVFSQYGPFWLELFGGVFALTGRSASIDTGRTVVLVEWLACSVAMGLVVREMSSSTILGLAASMLAFEVLDAIATEPMHPSSLVCVLLTAMVVVVTMVLPRSPRAALAALGALSAALALTKINTGGFLMVAVVLAFGSTHGDTLRRRFVVLAAAAVLVALPVLVIGTKITEGADQNYAWVVASGGLALALVVVDEPRLRGALPGRAWTAVLAGAAAVTVPVIGIALAMGTRVGDLVDSVLIRPTRLSDAFSVPLVLPPQVLDWGLLAVAAAFVVRVSRSAVDTTGPLLLISAAGRLLAGLAIWFSIMGSSPVTVGPASGPLALSVLLAWVAAIPTAADATRPPSSAVTRVLLPTAAITESLQAFPVAGSQVASRFCSMVPVGAMCLRDGTDDLRAWAASRSAGTVDVVRTVISALGLVLAAKFAIAAVVRPLHSNRSTYRAERALPFPSATRVHLPAPERSAIIGVTRLLQSRCTSFQSLPGMASFYVWTRQRPPTGFNVGPWWSLLSHREQQAIVVALSRTPRSCVIRNDDLVAFWTRGKRLPTDSPLLNFIDTAYKPLGRFGGYRVLVRR